MKFTMLYYMGSPMVPESSEQAALAAMVYLYTCIFMCVCVDEHVIMYVCVYAICF